VKNRERKSPVTAKHRKSTGGDLHRAIVEPMEPIIGSTSSAQAFRQRRVLVAVEAWYEWAVEGGQKIPHALGHSDGSPVVLGGIWECWRSPIGDRILTLAIVTTPATAELTAIHGRMSLVLAEPDWPVWLGEVEGDPTPLLRPAPSGRITT
jgi:putative SOS response-associated peptidase YedK